MIKRTRKIPKSLFSTKGVFHHSSFFTLKVSPYEGDSRLAVSVSKKVALLAVDRNRIRRRVYSVLNSLLPTIIPNHLFFFQAKKGADKASFDEIRKNIISLLKTFSL